MADWDRRSFLARAAKASLGIGGLGAGVLSCRDSKAPDGGPADAGEVLAGDGGRDADDSASDVDVDSAQRQLTKPPFSQVEGPRTVVVRFETRRSDPIEVRLEGSGTTGIEKQTSTTTRRVDFRWPPEAVAPLMADRPDEPGTYTVHEVRFEDLSRGAVRNWVVHLGDGEELTGRVRVPPPRGAPFKFQFLADTMHPNSRRVGAELKSRGPDLVLHGGDIQYQSNPLDTYNGLFHALAGVMADGAMHFAIGNHEREGRSEFSLFWKRLLARRTPASQPSTYHAFSFGGIHFVMLNSESGFERGSPQFQWMKKELQRADRRSDIRFSVAVFHRPFFTFGNSAPDLRTRDAFHPVFRDRGVKLVLTGHNHCYERFVADGVTYVVDGGGGAARTPPNASREEVLAKRPADADRRRSADASYGGVTVDVASDGTVWLERRKADGFLVDATTL